MISDLDELRAKRDELTDEAFQRLAERFEKSAPRKVSEKVRSGND